VVWGKSIYPAVFFHFMLNLAAYGIISSQGLDPSPLAWLLLSLLILPPAVIGIYLLRSLPHPIAPLIALHKEFPNP
jgi:ABC-type molybdate transport system permease subunit